jgi:hypothetical protein
MHNASPSALVRHPQTTSATAGRVTLEKKTVRGPGDIDGFAKRVFLYINNLVYISNAWIL